MAPVQSSVCIIVLLLLLAPSESFSQDVPVVPGDALTTQDVSKADSDEKSPTDAPPIVVSDEPKNIDPATLVFPPLAKKVTVEFHEASIREVVDWIQDEASVTVLVNEAALAEVNILASDPVSAQLTGKPLYLLLDRLSSIGLGWYVEDDILHITSTKKAASHLTTLSINIGTFLDQEFVAAKLLETIQSGTGEGWEESGDGEGSLVLLGDVLFVRQNDQMHRRVKGLLKGLEKQGRQTFVDDPTSHLGIREGLDAMISVDFQNKPLAEALVELARQSGLEIRWDVAAFRANRIREREPISLQLKNQKLTTVLGAIVAKLKMTWTLRNGSILITSKNIAADLQKTAIYDVRDLCRDHDESSALSDAIMTQTAPASWMRSGDGNGVMTFPKSGMMVVRQTERVHAAILTQLSAYRQALKSSKVRKKQDKSQDPITVYYQLPTAMAAELQVVLPSMLVPKSWKSEQNPKSMGTISKLTSRATFLDSDTTDQSVIVENSVLIILQTRENHELIRDLIANIENGNDHSALGGGGFGGGGGGFGGGVFDIPSERRNDQGTNKN